MKQKAKRSLNDSEGCKSKIDWLIKYKIDFKLKMSNYTTEIICPSIPYMNIKFLKKPQGVKAFLAYNKIKTDLITWTANEMPDIKKENCTYYDFSRKLKTVTGRDFTNMDLTAAYATILYNNLFIQKSTFEYIMKLPKMDRLVCVGMLASKKDLFTYQNGVAITHEEIINPLENYFYYCVDYTANLMRDIAVRLENDFIFSWVDSVYYRSSPANDFLVSNELEKAELKGKFQECTYLKIDETVKHFKISFFDEKLKPKNFTIPKNKTPLKIFIMQHLNLI